MKNLLDESLDSRVDLGTSSHENLLDESLDGRIWEPVRRSNRSASAAQFKTLGHAERLIAC